MISRDALIAISSCAGYFSLLFGTIGQAAFMSPVVKLHLPLIIAVPIFLLPWLLVYTITFTNQPFLPPSQFRFCLVFAACWFTVLTLVAETLYHFGHMPPDSPQYARALSRGLMHFGWLSLLYFIPAYWFTLSHQSKRDAELNQLPCASDEAPSP